MQRPSTPLITSLTNSFIKEVVELKKSKKRNQEKLFLIETPHLIEEAYRAGIVWLQIVEQDYQGPLFGEHILRVSKEICKKLSSTQSVTSVFAICEIQEHKLCGTRFLYCEHISDPGNLGTLIRSAHSFGYDGVICGRDSVDFYNDKVIRSSQGALFHLTCIVLNQEEMVDFSVRNKLSLVGTDVEVGLSEKQIFKDNLILIVGNESTGLSVALKEKCDQLIRIETTAFESLNVSIAGSILMYLSKK